MALYRWCRVCLLHNHRPRAAAEPLDGVGRPERSMQYGTLQFYGGRLRAEYDLISPNKPLRLRLEVGGYWEPTHNFYTEPTDSTEFLGRAQTTDIAFGMTASLTPVPRARFAPYVTIGLLARQSWANGWSSYTVRFVSNTHRSLASTSGQMIFPVGLGIRARLGDRTVQVELRRWEQGRSAIMVGTSLPF